MHRYEMEITGPTWPSEEYENPFDRPHDPLLRPAALARQAAVAPNWEQQIPEVLKGLQTVLSSVWKETARLEMLEKEVLLLKREMSERSLAMEVPIQTLAPEPYEVIKPFHVVVQAGQDDYIASFFDASLSASGDTQDEAVYNLKDILIAAFDSLGEHREDQLGPGPRRQLAVLKEFIRKTG
jgi:hypothetical protein